MSPIVAAVLVHLAGLLWPAAWPVAAAVLAGPAAAVVVRVAPGRARWAVGLALSLLALAGVFRGRTAAARAAGCVAALEAQATVRLRAHDAIAPGVAGWASWRHGPCRVAVRVQVERGTAPAGAVVLARGRAVPTDRGVRLLEATILVPPGTAVERRWAWRAGVERALDRAFGHGPPAALARALVTGEASRLEPALRERWAAAGLVHMLSVSGLHVALLIDAGRALLGRWLPAALAEGVALAVIAGYVWLLGWPAPATRAAVLAGVSAATRRLQRPTDPWAAWAIACLVPLRDAATARDLGYQLSALGAAGLVLGGLVWRRTAAAWARRRRDGAPDGAGRRRVLRPVLQGFVSGAITSLVTLPLSLWAFGQWSVVAPVTNLVGGPLMAVAQPLLFLTVLASPLPPLAGALAWGARVPMAAADLIAVAGASVPGAVLAWTPPVLTLVAVVVCIAALGFALAGPPGRRRRRLRAAGIALALGPAGSRATRVGAECALHVLDVGQGDALALRTGGGRWVVIDAGPAWRGGDAARRVAVPYLARRGGAVALLALSHADLDHAGGAPTLVAALRPAVVWDPGAVATGGHYVALLEAARDGAPRWHRPAPGTRVLIDDLLLEVLAPDAEWRAASPDANRASLILRATCVATGARPAVRFLLTGDADAAAEARLLAQAGDDVRAEVLKVPHHGSRTSSTEALLDAVAPAIAVASIGRGNRYGHPAPEVVARYARRGIPLLRTDRDGPIVIRAGPRGAEVVAP